MGQGDAFKVFANLLLVIATLLWQIVQIIFNLLRIGWYKASDVAAEQHATKERQQTDALLRQHEAVRRRGNTLYEP